MHHAGDRNAAADRTELARFAIFRPRFAGDQARHLRPVERQRCPDKRGFVAAHRAEIGAEQGARHGFQLLRRGFFEIFDNRQRRAAHLRLQLGNQRLQQLLPVAIARQHVNIKRRLALFRGCFDAGRQIHLQRVVIEHHLLGMRDKRGKTQVIAQRIIFSQLAQACGAAVIEIFQSGNNNGGITSAVRLSLFSSWSCGMMRILIQMIFPVSRALRDTSAGGVSSPRFW